MRLAALVVALIALAAVGLGVVVGGQMRGVANPWLAPAAELAERHGWSGGRIDAGYFELMAYRHFGGAPDGLLVIYIEGDGYAWKSTTELSDDPSPRTPRVLELAMEDPAVDVAYLARPCQYLPADELRHCPSFVWSLSRYADYVVDALDRAIDSLKREAGATRVRLVGYSGGGGLAALVAARRDDVEGIVTIAANLDHAVWTQRLGITPLIDSMNAADVAALVENIPQVHFVGADDTNVTRAEVDAYVGRMDDDSRVEVVVVPGADHACCWVELWPDLLATWMPPGP